ncbi:MAG: hypothetical protein GYB41_16370 [Oceanospirillales bacterium]|nr:hypothetical protein [Oceanospirillales bacterium]
MYQPALGAAIAQHLEQLEGRIAHMYRDTRGYITIGVGHLLATEQDATALAFIHRDTGLAATPDAIRQEYQALSTRPYGQRHGASNFAAHTNLRLPDAEIDTLTRQHIDRFGHELLSLYGPAFDTFPDPIKLALFDMIFNLGLTKLRRGFPRFNQHIHNRNWTAAAKESHRLGISEARNRSVHKLLSG